MRATASRRNWARIPETGEAITLRTGRFGPFVQRGEEKKPKRAGIPKGVDASDVDLEYALKLLTLPREVGTHPETGKPIVSNFGRFGPYLLHDGSYASLETAEDVFTIGLNRAVTVIAEKKARGPAAAAPKRSRNWANMTATRSS